MPELPEMEHYRQMLETKVLGQKITGVEINRPKSVNISPTEFSARLLGSSIIAISRQGKNLFFHLDNQQFLHLHLMLGGWMFYSKEEETPARTKQVVLQFGAKNLYFINLRLGYLRLISPLECTQVSAELGPDIFSAECTQEYVQHLLTRKKGFLKAVLVDQKNLAGLGSAYSDEICFKAGIRPDKDNIDLRDEQKISFFQNMRPVLERALQLGGYMEHPFFPGDELTGGYNANFYVYDRAGEKCPTCSETIIRGERSGKKFFYCPFCQN